MDWRALFGYFRHTRIRRSTAAVKQQTVLSKQCDSSGIVVRQLADPDQTSRKQAAEALLGSGTAVKAIPAIVSLFAHPDRSVRRDAIWVIAKLGPSGYVAAPKLIESLADQDVIVRRIARRALLQVDPHGDLIFEALAHSDAKVRESAIHVLPRILKQNHPPLDKIIAHLADDTPGVRDKIAELLVQTGETTIPALVRALEDPKLKRIAVSVLARIGDAAAPAVESVVELALRDRSMAIDAFHTLASIGSAAVQPLVRLLDEQELDSPIIPPTEMDRALAAVLATDVSRRRTVTGEICNALARIGSVSQLNTALRHSRSHVRVCAANALGTMYSLAEPTIPSLVSSLEDSSEDVRAAAHGALESLVRGPEARVNLLLDALGQERTLRVREGLQELAAGEAELAILLQKARSEELTTRRLASVALFEMLPRLRTVRVPNPFGREEVIDYRSLTPEILTEMLHNAPYAFEYLYRLHSPDAVSNFTGPSSRGRERLSELTAKVAERRRLLAEAEAELAVAAIREHDKLGTSEFEAKPPPEEKSSSASEKTGKDAPNSTTVSPSSVGAPPLDLCCGAPEEFEQAEPSKIGHSDVAVVRVLFATDRKRTGLSEPKKVFWNERAQNGELSLGVCEVSIPKSDRHKLGGLEKPSIYRLEFREDPNKHVVLVGVQTKEEKDFFVELQEKVGRSERKEAFIFVHGYDNTFEDAARRAGQFAYDLQFDGAPILYSWPSLGKWWRYAADETNVTWTVPHLESFLGSVVAKSGARTIHLIAHSMGNRALTSALELLVAKKSLPAGMLRHIVLTAPDIDSETFNQLAVAIAPAGERLTMYSNHRDRALRLSKLFHFYRRAGSTILIVRGMDTIDASAVDTSFTHHSYFGSSRTVLADLSLLLSEGKPPSKRFGMREHMTEKGAYYVFRP